MNKIGQKIGRLTIVSRQRVNDTTYFTCDCDCGKSKQIRDCNLGKNTFSCGCIKSEIMRKAAPGLRRKKWHSSKPLKNLRGSTINSYRSMLNRCTNPKSAAYHHYGGRGINICREWVDSYDSFVACVGERPSPKHSLDRIDANGNYEPGNVRWATRHTQSRNTRRNRFYRAFCFEMCLQDFSKVFKIKQSTLWNRLKKGLSMEQAISYKRGNH